MAFALVRRRLAPRWAVEAGTAAGLYLTLALAATYPLWVAPGGRVESLADPLLNSYLLDWVRFAIFRQVYDFFQAGFFWPHADALAYGEHLLTPALLTLPIAPPPAGAVAAHNVSLIEGYGLSALGAYALGRWHFRHGAALLGGLIYGFAGYRIAQSGHVQLVHGEFFPLMFLGLEGTLAREGRRWPWLLGVAAAAQCLTSWYWAVFAMGTFVPYAAARCWMCRGRLNRRRASRLAVALGLAVAAVVPMGWPTWRLMRQNALFRPAEGSRGLSARAADWLRPTERSLLHGWGRARAEAVTPERHLFPGLVGLAGLAAAAGFVVTQRGGGGRPGEAGTPPLVGFPAGLWLVLTLTLALLAAADGTPVGEGGRGSGLPLALMRVPARWGLPALLGVALSAAFAWERLSAIVREPWVRVARAAALSLGLAESLYRPMPFVEVESAPPAVYRWLAEQAFPSPVLELPLAADDDNRPMLHATWHRQPIMNGTNGFFPPGHPRLLRELAAFPEGETIERLRERRVRYVVITRAAADGDGFGWPEERLARTRQTLGGRLATRDFGSRVVVDLGEGAAGR